MTVSNFMSRCVLLLLFVACAPLCRAQTTTPATRPATTQKSPRWEKDILAFEAADRETPPPPNPVLFVGSSTFTRWTQLAADFPSLPVLNRAFGGSTMLELNSYMDRIVLPYHPSRIVVYEGSNDISDGQSPEAVVVAMKEFHQRVHRALPDTQIYFLSIIPAPSRVKAIAQVDRTNVLLQAYIAEHPELHYIDARNIWADDHGVPDMKWYVADRLHPNRAAYEKLIPLIRAALNGPASQPSR
jgi:lysophospholipase L1-like esterase